jgi:hypothetical protein
MPYSIIYPNGDAEDEVVINKRVYRVRFLPKHAEHVMDNYSSKEHRIKHREILSLIKDSIFVRENLNTGFCVGRFKKRIYMTIINLSGGELLVKTSYLCNRPDLIDQLKDFESV